LLSWIGMLAALAIIGRIAFLWAPNYALTYFVVFFSGVLLGPLAGAGVGVIAMTTTNLLLSGLHPVLLANAGAMAMIGMMGGLLRRILLAPATGRLDKSFQWVVAGAAGLFGTFLFSAMTDLLSFLLQFMLTPEGATVGTRALLPLLLMGLAFNLGPAIMNMVLFATATPALLAGLQKSGHLWNFPAPRVIGAGTAQGWGNAARTPAPAEATTTSDRP
jgi:hypothetical protein